MRTKFGTWLIRRSPFVIGFVFGFSLPAYLIVGAWDGMRRAVGEWLAERRMILGAAARGSESQDYVEEPCEHVFTDFDYCDRCGAYAVGAPEECNPTEEPDDMRSVGWSGFDPPLESDDE